MLSARTPQALRDLAGHLADHLGTHPDASVLDVGHALATTRTPLEERAVLTDGTIEERRQTLTAFARSGSNPNIITGRTSDGRLGMVFSGQGSQHHNMGRELYDTYPVFADALDAACTAIDPHLDIPLHDILYGPDPDLIHQTRYTQPALFAFQTALYHLWQHWGIHPHTLTGHSIGEITAAHAAGILTLQDAAQLITTRGRLMQTLPTNGTMAAINTDQTTIQPYLDGHEDKVGIAAINTPTSLVLSGETTTLNTILTTLKNQGIRVKKLRVSHAFHSPLMEPILNDLHTTTEQLTFHEPHPPHHLHPHRPTHHPHHHGQPRLLDQPRPPHRPTRPSHPDHDRPRHHHLPRNRPRRNPHPPPPTQRTPLPPHQPTRTPHPHHHPRPPPHPRTHTQLDHLLQPPQPPPHPPPHLPLPTPHLLAHSQRATARVV